MRVQLRLATDQTHEEYVKQRGWERANLARCPAHPGGGCGMRVHTSYLRKRPPGVWIRRYYCRKARQTFSLLPDFAACGLSADLAEVEAAVSAAEGSRSIAEAARTLRPELLDERHAARWVRRRLERLRAALLAVVTLVPALSGCPPTLGALRHALGVAEVLRGLRAVAEPLLASLNAPLGFVRRALRRRAGRRGRQHKAGPDPPLEGE